MSKNTNPRPSTLKKPDELSSSMDNSGQPKLPASYTSPNSQKTSQKPNSKSSSKVSMPRASQQFPPNLTKEISTEKSSNQADIKSKQNVEPKTIIPAEKSPVDTLQIEEETENIDSSIVKSMTEKRSETAPRIDEDDKGETNRSEKRRVTANENAPKHQKEPSIAQDIIQPRGSEPSQQTRGIETLPSQNSTVQKAKINLGNTKEERSRSNSTVYRESPTKAREENNSPSRKNSFISNNSSDLNLAKTQSLRTPGTNTTNINFFSSNTVNVNNFNNVFFSGRNSKAGAPAAPDSATSRKKPSGFNLQKASVAQSQSIDKSDLPAQPGFYRATSNLSQGGAPSATYSASALASKVKVKSSNIKVVARFRPLNKMEQELIDNGLGSDCSVFPNERSCYLMPDSQSIFTLDRIFNTHAKQEDVYDFVGRETMDDVLQGYNGTIFAYGQTSSGKTFTMYGDIHDSGLKGIIPRATQHIFDYIDGVEMEVEFVLKCSMLEIYKETLYDLLNERNSDLKIKEHPQRGIYVDGLMDYDVIDEEELLGLIEMGEKSKMMAATRMNQHSSRSHTLFIMEITQKLPNQTEKRGRLNLVDLAGSEKVGKTGAMGDTLEEAKKINLSLSCLGNVIHSLTTNNEHIPYRDSKLTRILQESLGGNYKTTLVVTCSPHSSNREESISTLKFATRAKTIKTHYKMNVQISPESMAALIEQLRLELEECRAELSRYKNGEAPQELISMTESKYMSLEEAKRFSRFKPGRNRAETEEDFKVDWKVGGGIYTPSVVKEINSKEIKKNHVIREAVTESDQINSKCFSDTENFMDEVASHSKKAYGNSYSYFKTNLELIKDNESLELKLSSYKNEVHRLSSLLEEKDYQLTRAQDENMLLKNSLLQLEKKNNEMSEEWEFNKIKFEKHNDNTEHLNIKTQVLEKQVLAISEALIECECSIENLLKEKANSANQKFLDYMRDNLEFKQFKLSDYFEKSPNFNYEPFYDQLTADDDRDSESNAQNNKNPYKESFISQLDLNSAFANATSKLSEYVEMPHKMHTMLQQNINTNMNEQGALSSEVQVYVLKHQLIQCMIINRHLERIIAALEWKQIIEYGKAKIKSNLTRVQEKQIKNMEEVLEKASVSHLQLRNRVEAVEMEGIRIRENLMNQQTEKKTKHMTHIEGGNTKFGRVLRSVNREPTRKGGRRGMTTLQGPDRTPKINRDGHELMRMKTDEGEDEPQNSWRNRKESTHNFSSFKMDTPRVESMTNFVKEIEKEINTVTKTPANLEEAEVILNMKNEIIEKLFKHLSSTGSTIVPQNQTVLENTINIQNNPQEEEYLKSEKDRLENKVLIIQTELDLEKTKSEQLKEAYIEGARQITHYKKLLEEMEISSRNALKLENENWQKVFDDLKSNQDREMLRKQEELRRIHDLLAGWIFKYMDLQEQKGVLPTHQEKILYETFKRKEIPDRSLLEKPLLTVKLQIPQNPSTPKATFTDRKTHDSNKKSTTKH